MKTIDEIIEIMRAITKCDEIDDCSGCTMPKRNNGERECRHFSSVVVPEIIAFIETMRDELAKKTEQLNAYKST